MTKRFRWTRTVIEMAAEIAKQKGVKVKLERDGSITIMPTNQIGNPPDDDVDGLEPW